MCIDINTPWFVHYQAIVLLSFYYNIIISWVSVGRFYSFVKSDSQLTKKQTGLIFFFNKYEWIAHKVKEIQYNNTDIRIK